MPFGWQMRSRIRRSRRAHLLDRATIGRLESRQNPHAGKPALRRSLSRLRVSGAFQLRTGARVRRTLVDDAPGRVREGCRRFRTAPRSSLDRSFDEQIDDLARADREVFRQTDQNGQAPFLGGGEAPHPQRLRE